MVVGRWRLVVCVWIDVWHWCLWLCMCVCVCGVVRKRTYHASYRTVGRYIWRLGRDSGDKKDVSLLGVVVSNITQQYPYE